VNIIYKNLIEKYISNLTENDIRNYAFKHNEILTKEETNIIYNHIKKYYKELLNKNITSFTLLKLNLRKPLFDKILLLYNEYQKYL
jgi:hypothetical protein